MEKSATQTILDEKMSELSPEKRELLELLFGAEKSPIEFPSESPNQPLTEVERELKQIWEDVLGVGAINKTDNFFALGGDSLHCIQIVAKARQVNLEFTTADLFESQTIERLAQKISPAAQKTNKLPNTKTKAGFADESGLSIEELTNLLERI